MVFKGFRGLGGLGFRGFWGSGSMEAVKLKGSIRGAIRASTRVFAGFYKGATVGVLTIRIIRALSICGAYQTIMSLSPEPRTPF